MEMIMNNVNSSIPFQQNLPPDDYVSDQIGKAVTLANMFDARKEALNKSKREQSIRDIFAAPGMFDAETGFAPSAVGQVAQYDIGEAQKLGNVNAAMGYKRAMANQAATHANLYGVQAETLPDWRQSQIDKNTSYADRQDTLNQKTQNDMLMQKHKNALNLQSSLLYNNGKDFDAESYDSVKNNFCRPYWNRRTACNRPGKILDHSNRI
jgi:hypothetical protein